MRLLAVGNMYPPHHLGGYELVWRGAMGHLRGLGHDVRVLTTDFRIDGVGPDDPGVHRELRWYWREHGYPTLSPRGIVALERHNARVLARHLVEHRPDVVTWWAMGGMSLSLLSRAARAGVPSLAFVHDDWVVYGPYVDRWTRLRGRLRLGRSPVRAVDRWLFVSEFTRARAQREVGALRDSAVVHSGIDASWVGPRPERPWRWRLLYVGRVDGRKGIATAVAALPLLPADARLVVAGGGDPGDVEGIRRLAAELGVQERVELLGPLPRERLPDVYADADAVVFPVTWNEPWGLVPLEAMAFGRPVVATGTGGSAEYLRAGENCLLFAPRDERGLAAALERLADDPRLRARLCRHGERTAAAHTDARFNAAVAREVAAAGGRRAGGRG